MRDIFFNRTTFPLFVAMLLTVSVSKGQHTTTQKGCNNRLLPVVFVHGFLASGDTWSLQVQRFLDAGYCREQLVVFNWNTLGSAAIADSLLQACISAVLQKTGAPKVNLVGHSAGGGLCYRYLADSLRSSKVAHYVHVGSMMMKTPAGKPSFIPTLNIYSTKDLVLKMAAPINGATNVGLTEQDHLEVATCTETFAAMYRFFNPGIAMKRRADSGKAYRIISGKALTLGENKSLGAADSVMVFSLNNQSGERKNELLPPTPLSANGNWPAVRIPVNDPAEIVVHPAEGRSIHYFYEPFLKDNDLVYLRTIPAKGMVASLLGKLPQSEKQSVIIIFTNNQAVVSGRDSLTVEDISLSTPSLAPASKTAIAVFVYDDGDGLTSYRPIGAYAYTPFLSGVDVFLDASLATPLKVYFNGRTIYLRRIPSAEGVMVLVLN